MRQHQWFEYLDAMRDHEQPRTLMYANGVPHAAKIISFLDSREGRICSRGLGSINNPLIVDRDGIIFEVDRQQMYVSAALLTSMCSQNGGPWVFLVEDWSYYYAECPPELRELLLHREAALITIEPVMSDDEFAAYTERVVTEVEDLFRDDVLPYGEVEAAFGEGMQSGLTFLHDLAATEQFLDIAAAAQYANWHAKLVKDHGGHTAALYAIKDACLNRLIRQYITSRTHERVHLSADKGALLVDCGIRVSLMGLNMFAYQRELHMPRDCVIRESRLKIRYVYPTLWEDIPATRPMEVG